jgi:sugar phosphate isomerase/epimerase
MLTRRDFLGRALAGAAASAAATVADVWGAGRPAWSGPIGLELFTVREMFAKDPGRTLKEVAAVGYREVEIGPGVAAPKLKEDLRAAGLTAPSGYFEAPKTVEDWKKTLELAHAYGVRYAVVGDNPRLDAEAWKRRAELYSQCGRLATQAGIQFCYHNHFREFERLEGTTGYDILLAECDPKLLKMEMDIFWIMYAGQDPLAYWRRYPGRFPLLHIKDIRKGVAINPDEDPQENGPNPFAPVGKGRIDWHRIFARVGEAGAKHIFVEQDRCNLPPLEAVKISLNYLKRLRLSA